MNPESLFERAEPPPKEAIRLNEAQRRAVEHEGGPLIVLAGPGTGKTRVITARVQRLLERGAEPESIVAMTFTRKATREMRDRLATAVGPLADRVRISTFHAFGAAVLRRFGDVLGLPSEPVVMDSAQSKRLLRELVAGSALAAGRAGEGLDGCIDEMRHYVSCCRNAARTGEDAVEHARAWLERAERNDEGLEGDALIAERARAERFAHCAELFARYEKACLERGWITQDDYIALPIRLMADGGRHAAIIRSEIRHMVVDEFQDVNAAQIELLRRLAPPENNPDLCVVGDDDQAIYAFRGSDTDAFDRFARLWTDHETIPLSVNYRSDKRIIDCGNAIITGAASRFEPDKVSEANPERACDEPASLEGVLLENDALAGPVIAAMILEDRKATGRPWKEYGVITRANRYADEIAAELELQGIPVDRRRELKPLDDQGVQDVLAWIRLLVGDDLTASVQRLLVRPPYGVDIETVEKWAQQYRRAASLADERDDEGFAGWVVREAGDAGPGVGMFARHLTELRGVCATKTADEAIERIVRRSGLAGAEELLPGESAERMNHLVQVLAFVRSRMPYLDQPRNLRAFWSYYNDLDETEQQFRVAGAEDEEAEADPLDRFGEEGAVSVITAHKAKGLEFDTVFVPRVRPGHGFPSSERADDFDALPEAFADRLPVDHADEERRLFYVACTRAERRLVLLAKEKKSKSKPDYFIEIAEERPELGFEIGDGALIMERANVSRPDALEAGAESDTHVTLINRELKRARQVAFAALHDAERAGLGPEMLDAIGGRLRDAAAMIAILASLRDVGAMPPGIEPSAADRQRLERVLSRLEGRRERAAAFRAMRAPLRLSYSFINDYQRCGRCFYVKHVLRLEESRTAEIALGDLVHKTLEKFYRDYAIADSEGRPLPGRDDLIRSVERIYRAELGPTQTFERTLLEQARAQLASLYDRLHDDAHIQEVEYKVDFTYPCAGCDHQLVAKIDRIDQLPDGRFRIVDYKTGSAWGKLTQPKADDLQLCIYAMALAHMQGADEPPEGVAEYWVLSTGERGSIDLAALKIEKARKTIEETVTGILAGRYPPAKSERECNGLCGILPEWYE